MSAEIKNKIISRFDKSQFKIAECGASEDGDWNDLDENIKEFIKQLNKCENISTMYSCEGHKEKDDAYLFFNVNENGWNIFWGNVMPELSEKFCFVHPEVSHGLYAMDWAVYTKANEYNAGITLRTDLENFIVEETGRVIIGWEEKKETFWRIIKETFSKYYPPKEEVVCPKCESNKVETREGFRRTSGPRVPGKLVSYGYYLEMHVCKDCLNVWDGKEINKK